MNEQDKESFEQEIPEQETQKIKLSNKQINILKLLDLAPNNLKNIYYLIGQLNSNYTSIYREVKTLEMLGALYSHKSTLTGKSFYIPKAEVIEAINNMNNEEVF